jgi:hypothetical protein
MAGRSQHLEQIMENQTRYDLNAAVENWRNELAAQPNLATDDRRELETHLRDAIAGFQQLGLNNEESFWLARHRVGQPPQLGDEFVKANPTAIWRERVFWMTMALLAYSLWSMVTNTTTGMLINAVSNWWALHSHNGSNYWFGLNPIVSGSILTAFRLLPLCLVTIFLLKGSVNQNSRFASFFYSRKNVIILAVTIIGLHCWLMVAGWHDSRPRIHGTSDKMTIQTASLWLNLISFVVWPLALTALTVWLMPTQNQKTPKRA